MNYFANFYPINLSLLYISTFLGIYILKTVVSVPLIKHKPVIYPASSLGLDKTSYKLLFSKIKAVKYIYLSFVYVYFVSDFAFFKHFSSSFSNAAKSIV